MYINFGICSDTVTVGEREARFAEPDTQYKVSNGCMQDGVIIDMDELANGLRSVITERGTKARVCSFEFPAELSRTKELTLPRMSGSKLDRFIVTQLEETMPEIRDYTVDYLPIDCDEPGKISVLAVMVRTALIEQYLKLADKLSLKCKAINMRFLETRERMMDAHSELGAYIAVDFLTDRAELSLYENDKVFTRTFMLKKEDNGLAEWGIAINVTAEDEADLASRLAGEINSLVQFQISRNRDLPVAQIFALGECEKHKAICDLCAQTLGREITVEGAVPDDAVPDTAVPDETLPDNGAPDETVPDNAAKDDSADTEGTVSL